MMHITILLKKDILIKIQIQKYLVYMKLMKKKFPKFLKTK